MTENTNNNDEVLFSINQISKILGVVPSTIRNWEKNGLFVAKRTKNNYRVYSLDDIEVLKKIRTLSIEQKTGNYGIKKIMTPVMSTSDGWPELENANTQTRYSKKLLSGKWKKFREDLNLTLEEVSEQVGISSSYLSKIENCQANISYEILDKLAVFYGKSVLDFFDKESDDNRVVKDGQGKIAEVGLPGVRMESLISQENHVFDPMIFTVDPGHGSLDTHRHHGEEFIYVLSGKLKVTLNNNEVYLLKKGDSMYFKSFEYHSWMNSGSKVAKLLWVHSPIETNI